MTWPSVYENLWITYCVPVHAPGPAVIHFRQQQLHIPFRDNHTVGQWLLCLSALSQMPFQMHPPHPLRPTSGPPPSIFTHHTSSRRSFSSLETSLVSILRDMLCVTLLSLLRTVLPPLPGQKLPEMKILRIALSVSF